MRRALVVLGTVLAVMAAVVPVHAQEKVDIRKVTLRDWPQVKVTVAARGLVEPEFSVSENGVTVADVEVQTFAETGRTIDVMLVIDTSGSMEGAPLTAALDAARSFVRSVPDNIDVGIVTFSDAPRVVLPLTSDRERALEVLQAPVAAGETALYDAVVTASEQFSSDSQRNIVLLSDGGDTASSALLPAAVAAARDADAAIFAVGLTSGEADVAALKRLAAGDRGRYAPAGTADLTTIYEELAEELQNQFVLSYKSTVEPGQQFSVEVASSSGLDSAVLLAPEVETASEPRRVEAPEPPLLRGTPGLVIALSLLFCSIALLVYALMGSRARKRRDLELARLISAHPQERGAERSEEGPVAWLPDALVGMADKVAQRSGSKSTFDHKLDRAGLSLTPGEFLAGSFVAAVAGLLVGLGLTRSLPLALLVAIAGAAGPYLALTVKVSRRFAKLQAQLPDILMILASSLRAGHSFLQALDSVASEIGDPGAREFSRLVAEIRLGRPVTEAMNELAERVGSDDFKWAMLAVNIQREVGGNLAEVLDTVASTMRGRDNVRRQVKVLSAEGRLSMYILGALPLAIGLYLRLVNPQYLALLYETRVGLVLLVTAGCLYVLGFAWMRKVVTIDV